MHVSGISCTSVIHFLSCGASLGSIADVSRVRSLPGSLSFCCFRRRHQGCLGLGGFSVILDRGTNTGQIRLIPVEKYDRSRSLLLPLAPCEQKAF